jgi:uncharacterized protein (DUF2141 family)
MMRFVALVVGVLNAADTSPSLDFEIKGLRSPRGAVVCHLFSRAEGFPDVRQSVLSTRAPAASNVVCRFAGLRAGSYAVTVFHDEDGDGQMDTNFFGIPTEGRGASNDARGTFGPPSFIDSRLYYRGQNELHFITMNY